MPNQEPEKLDFYWSSDMYDMAQKLSKNGTLQHRPDIFVNIEGERKQYTFCCKHGDPHNTGWTDMQFIGTATMDDVMARSDDKFWQQKGGDHA